MSPNAGGRGVLRGLSQREQLYTGAQINFGDLTPYLTYGPNSRRRKRRREKTATVGWSSSAPSSALQSSTGWDTQQASKQGSFLENSIYKEYSLTDPFAGLLLNPLVTDLRSGKAEISFAGSLQVGPRS
jgi:hypothetical protein